MTRLLYRASGAPAPQPTHRRDASGVQLGLLLILSPWAVGVIAGAVLARVFG
jgi:hypothetical protein